MKTKRTWNICENEKITSLFNEVKAVTQSLYPEFFDGVYVELFIDSSTSHLGQCNWEYTKRYSQFELKRAVREKTLRYKRVVILLSKYVFNMSDDEIRNTIVHEFGHMVSPGYNHDYFWENRANTIGKSFGVTCERLAGKNETDQFHSAINKTGIYKYTVECPSCHTQWKFQRMCNTVKYPSKYHCVKCQKQLVLVTNNELN